MKKLILILFLLASANCHAEEHPLKIHFIDIGEGDAILIQAEDKNVLIDTGNITSGYKLIDYLKANNVKLINHLIITHPDLEHISGVFSIMPEFDIKNLCDNGVELNTSGNSIYNSYEKNFRSKKNYKVLKEDDLLKTGDLKLKVIWPQDLPLSASFNHNSLVIILNYKGFRCLLTGDIDKSAEAELLKEGIDLRAEVLKIAHHGAGDATSEDFLRKVNPKFAIISVGDFAREYPAGAVLDLLTAKNIKTYRTDKDGTVVLTVASQNNYSIATEK